MIEKLKIKVEKIITDFSGLNENFNKSYEYEPSMYLYGKLMKKLRSNELKDLLSHSKFMELLYVTLWSWGMNIRGAKMKDYESFSREILKKQNQVKFVELSKYEILELNDEKLKKIKKIIRELFEDLNIMESKTKITANSKLMHFILPDLIFPIDSKIQRFIGTLKDNPDEFLKGFLTLFDITRLISEKINLYEYLNKDKWNISIPKIIDNLITAYYDKI